MHAPVHHLLTARANQGLLDIAGPNWSMDENSMLFRALRPTDNRDADLLFNTTLFIEGDFIFAEEPEDAVEYDQAHPAS